jgi:hypothetical protein
MSDQNTYIDLFNFLIEKNMNRNNFLEWLTIPWTSQSDPTKRASRDKLEVIFRLFAMLSLHPFQNIYSLCKGSFNNGESTICTDNDLNDLFHSKTKDKGSASDSTFQDEKTILTISAKNWGKNKVCDFDIGDMVSLAKEYYNKTHKMGFLVKNINTLKELIMNANRSSIFYVNHIQTALENRLIFDIEYLADLYIHMPKNLPKRMQKIFIPQFHQDLICKKLLSRIDNSKTKKFVINSLPRSGKTYIMGMCIKQTNSSNILIITLRPGENFDDYKDFFSNYLQQYNTIFLSSLNTFDKPKIDKMNIIICSKQFLHNKTSLRKIRWLENINFDLIFVDEGQDGGTTKLASDVYNIYCKTSPIIFVTATCEKPVFKFNISKKDIITWDLEDVTKCRTLTEQDKQYLIEKHGENFKKLLNNYSDRIIRNTYEKYPKLIFTNCYFSPDIKREIINSKQGWSLKSLLYVGKNGEFKNFNQTLKLFKSIFGDIKWTSNIKTTDIKCSLYKWQQIMEEYKSRINNKEPLVIMVFINYIEVVKVGSAIKKLLIEQVLGNLEHKIDPEYEIIVLNSQETKGRQSMKLVVEAQKRAKNHSKKGVIIITGKMCTTAASIPKCDISLLLDDSKSWDEYYQKIWRSGTPDFGKTCAIICDLNNRRNLTFIAVLSEYIYGKSNPESIEKILSQNMVEIRNDNWYDPESKIFIEEKLNCQQLSKLIHKYWMQDVGATRVIIQALSINAKISDKYIRLFNSYFDNITSKKKLKDVNIIIEDIPEEIQGKDRDIDNGIEEKHEKSSSRTKSEEIVINMFQEVFSHIVVLFSLLTIQDNEYDLGKICDIILNDNTHVIRNISKKDIVISLLQGIWGKKITEKTIEIFKKAYTEELQKNNTLTENIRYLKERFIAVKDNPRTLYQVIEEFLIPHEIERKNNAEISTPEQLRKKMIDTIPIKLWTTKIRVFEPCCGKGGFVIDLFERFMLNLSDKFPDEQKRKKFILEKMIYFGDINPLNIWLCCLLLDPKQEYKLQYYLGDTLTLDIKKEWGLENFNMIIGNPPYSTDPSKPNTKSIYNLFIEKYIDLARYFMFVIPSKWFSGGKGLDKFRKFMMNRKDIKLLCHEPDCKKWFSKVEIKGGVCYFLKIPKETKCSFNGIKIQLDKYDIIVEPKYIPLLEKIKKYETIESIYMTSSYYKVRPNDKRLSDISSCTTIPCYVSSLKRKDRVRYIEEKQVKQTERTWKVITAEASGKGRNGFGFACVSNPNQIYTDSYVSFRVKNEDEGKSLLSYMKCKLPNYVLGIRKMTHHINTDTIKWIPLVSLDREWTDEKVFEYFSISEDLLV